MPVSNCEGEYSLPASSQGGGMNDEDFSGIEAKALASGAKKAYVLDLQVQKRFHS